MVLRANEQTSEILEAYQRAARVLRQGKYILCSTQAMMF